MTTNKTGTFKLLGRVWEYETLDDHGLTALRVTTRSHRFGRFTSKIAGSFALGCALGVACAMWSIILCGF
jgi:hypothetical protein